MTQTPAAAQLHHLGLDGDPAGALNEYVQR